MRQINVRYKLFSYELNEMSDNLLDSSFYLNHEDAQVFEYKIYLPWTFKTLHPADKTIDNCISTSHYVESLIQRYSLQLFFWFSKNN